MRSIFGKEPALIISFVGAVIAALAGMKLEFLNAGQAVALTSAVAAVLIAVTTRPVGPSLFVAAFTAVAALFGEYGLHWSDAMISGVGAVILAGFALFGIRPQVTPNTSPVPISPESGNVR